MQATQQILESEFYVLSYRNSKSYFIEADRAKSTLRCYLFLEKRDAIRYGSWVSKVAEVDLIPNVSTASDTLDILMKITYSALMPETKGEPAPANDGHKDIEILMVHSLTETESGTLIPNCKKFHNSNEKERN